MSEPAINDLDTKYSIPEQLFIDASKHCPRSNVGQAAYIAFRAKELDIDPLDYADLLKKDPKALSNMLDVANVMHNIVLKDKAPKLDPERVMRLFKRDFELAQDFKILDNDSLKDIYIDMFRQYKDSDSPVVEFEFEDKVRQKYDLKPSKIA